MKGVAWHNGEPRNKSDGGFVAGGAFASLYYGRECVSFKRHLIVFGKLDVFVAENYDVAVRCLVKLLADCAVAFGSQDGLAQHLKLGFAAGALAFCSDVFA